MITVVIVIHLMVVLALVAVVLLQKSEGGGLGIGSSGGFLSSRGTANVLTRTTAYLALTFFATSLALSWLAGLDRKPTSILNTGAPAEPDPAGRAEHHRAARAGRAAQGAARCSGSTATGAASGRPAGAAVAVRRGSSRAGQPALRFFGPWARRAAPARGGRNRAGAGYSHEESAVTARNVW